MDAVRGVRCGYDLCDVRTVNVARETASECRTSVVVHC